MNKSIEAFVYGSSMVTTVLAIVSFLRGRKDTALLLGLWAPTVFAWGAFFNSEQPPCPPAEKTKAEADAA